MCTWTVLAELTLASWFSLGVAWASPAPASCLFKKPLRPPLGAWADLSDSSSCLTQRAGPVALKGAKRFREACSRLMQGAWGEAA